MRAGGPASTGINRSPAKKSFIAALTFVLVRWRALLRGNWLHPRYRETRPSARESDGAAYLIHKFDLRSTRSRNAIASGWMIICTTGRPDAVPVNPRGSWTVEAVAAGAALILALLAGCASPGPPLPPSLKLPEVVTGLTSSRVGDEVRLRWTTPSRTTDKLLIAGPIEAEICRETLAAAAPATAGKGGQSAAPGSRENAVTALCSPVVLRKRVTPGASEAVDALPAELTAAPARLLAYRVQLRNASGRTAGASAAVFAASGPAPHAVEDLRGKATKAGVVLEWRPEAQGTGSREQGTEGTESIELDRTILQPATANTTTTTASTSPTTTAGSGLERKGGLPGATKEPSESRFRAGGELGDAGGTVDRTALIGHAYRYTAQRVRSVELGGQTLELRSLPSVEVTVEMKDVFPPEAPVGLVAVPGFAGEPSAGQSAAQPGEQAAPQIQRPAIDLSWEPDLEPRIAGYRVYRRDLDGDAPAVWQRLSSEPVPVAAYRDLSVVAGRRYAYRVTAVNAAGNESAPSVS